MLHNSPSQAKLQIVKSIWISRLNVSHLKKKKTLDIKDYALERYSN
jgi:hypothetical protein